MGGWVNYESKQGTIRAYAAEPKTPKPWPALIIIHGVNGNRPHMADVAQDFANDGYLAIVPDIYSNDAGYKDQVEEDILAAAHVGPYGGDPVKQKAFLDSMSEERRASIMRARAWIDQRPTKTYIEIIEGAFHYLKNRPDVGAVGCMGFCMGGRLTGELAVTGVDLAAGVIYYGQHPKLDLVSNIKCPIEGHYGITDKGITGKVPDFDKAMKEAGKDFSYFIYDADHGFSLMPGSRSYNEACAKLSFERTKKFLAKHLKPAALRSAAE